MNVYNSLFPFLRKKKRYVTLAILEEVLGKYTWEIAFLNKIEIGFLILITVGLVSAKLLL